MPSEFITTVTGRPAAASPAGSIAVSVENVSKWYPSRRWMGLRYSTKDPRHALRNVSLAVREGEMVGLLGPNGAGKTTLLKSIATLLSVSEGRILVLGRDVNADPVASGRAIGLVTCDERSFYWRLTGRQNLRFFASLYRLPDKSAGARIDRLFEMLGLSHAADQPYHSYSTGMRQKMAIARGLLSEPRLILYDEPTRSLDPLSAQGIREWIRASRAASPRTTHVIATNQLHEAEQLCDRVIILNRGSIIADDSIGSIRKQFHTDGRVEHRITFSGAPGLSIHPSSGMGLFEVSQEPAAGGAATLRIVTGETGEGLTAALSHILARGGTVLRCETAQLSLDEMFCSLVRGDRTEAKEGR
ncbi:MAG TPA: ABC transporter ATP-binding protein [Candidatus Sulfopaludibacter sp.]|nr:ABC transporter ATP-binding protein [Candidatus Sulfopaludibacter sp.]